MMYMMLLSHWEIPGEASDAERDRLMGTLMQWWQEGRTNGTIVDGNQLQPPDTATTVVIADGRSTLVDGPFLESKEAIGGYGVLEVPDLDAALALARTYPLAGSRIELRPVIERVAP
ncbi:MAG: YciI family protein [Candidatus Dormiibacterota bacterium]